MTDELKQWEYDRGYAKGKADALEKIRAEVKEMKLDVDLDLGNETIYNNAIKDVLQIIDKYRAESEEKHETDRKG